MSRSGTNGTATSPNSVGKKKDRQEQSGERSVKQKPPQITRGLSFIPLQLPLAPVRLFAIGSEDALPAVVHRFEHRDTGQHQPCKSASEKSENPSFQQERGVFYSRRRDIAEESYRKNQRRQPVGSGIL
jgi:hypothetical protein